jgi:hypothetical protein
MGQSSARAMSELPEVARNATANSARCRHEQLVRTHAGPQATSGLQFDESQWLREARAVA